MTGLELLETYPIAAEVIGEFYHGKMVDSLMEDNSIPDDFKEMVKSQQFDNEYIAKFIDANPRVLFDIFDDNDLIINVVHTQQGFTWDVESVKSVELYPYRRDAEYAAVERAFQLLNDKLTITVNERQDS